MNLYDQATQFYISYLTIGLGSSLLLLVYFERIEKLRMGTKFILSVILALVWPVTLASFLIRFTVRVCKDVNDDYEDYRDSKNYKLRS